MAISSTIPVSCFSQGPWLDHTRSSSAPLSLDRATPSTLRGLLTRLLPQLFWRYHLFRWNQIVGSVISPLPSSLQCRHLFQLINSYVLPQLCCAPTTLPFFDCSAPLTSTGKRPNSSVPWSLPARGLVRTPTTLPCRHFFRPVDSSMLSQLCLAPTTRPCVTSSGL